MVNWNRDYIKSHHNYDRDSQKIILGDAETQLWWIIDKLNGSASVWSELGSSPREVQREFEDQRDALGIDPSLYDDIEIVSQEELGSLANYNDHNDVLEPIAAEEDRYSFDASEGWGWG